MKAALSHAVLLRTLLIGIVCSITDTKSCEMLKIDLSNNKLILKYKLFNYSMVYLSTTINTESEIYHLKQHITDVCIMHNIKVPNLNPEVCKPRLLTRAKIINDEKEH